MRTFYRTGPPLGVRGFAPPVLAPWSGGKPAYAPVRTAVTRRPCVAQSRH